MRGLRPGQLAVPGEPLDRPGLTRRTIPVTTSAMPMINIGTARALWLEPEVTGASLKQNVL